MHRLKTFCILAVTISFPSGHAVASTQTKVVTPAIQTSIDNQAATDKSKLSVLYVGHDPQSKFSIPSYAPKKTGKRIPQLKKERMSAFKSLLEMHFADVRTLNVKDYKPEMSSNVDVTIFDAMPPPIESIDMGSWTKHLRMPRDFDRPTIMIGTVAPSALGRNGMGFRMDHL